MENPGPYSRPGVVAKVIATDAAADVTPIDWDEAGRLFAAERSYWVATTSDDGRPHVRPVLAVWVDERIYSTTNPATRKGRNLTSRPSAALTAQAPMMDIVMEGPIAGSTTHSDSSESARPIRTSTDGPSPSPAKLAASAE